MMEQKIPHSIGYSTLYKGMPDVEDHRLDYSRCPYCHKEVDVHSWITIPHVKEVVLKNRRFSDSNKVIIIGECPFCSMPSWGHWEIKILGLYATPDWPEHEKYPYDMDYIRNILKEESQTE